MYLLTVLLFLFFLIGASVYLITRLISVYYKTPYVPTSTDIIHDVLMHADLKPYGTFYDLGAGDGRVVRVAQKFFAQEATGFEANPLLCWYARLRFNIKLVRQNLFSVPLGNADAIYIYLFPNVLPNLEAKLDKECKPGTKIISFTFQLNSLQDRLTNQTKIGNHCIFYYTM